jgi:hypothetical protein
MMMNWLHYLLEANLYLAAAYGCYWLLFRKQTFYTANRVYLLVSTAICFVIPMIQLEALQPQNATEAVQQTVSTVTTNIIAMSSAPSAGSFITLNKAITAIYLLVCLCARFIYY